MALYKDQKYLHHVAERVNIFQECNFDDLYTCGTPAPCSGIFRCENCGNEIAINKDDSLPPETHSEHAPLKGKIAWRLIVKPEH